MAHRSARSKRHNPYHKAIPRIVEGADGVLARTPPPEHVRQALEDFDRRMADPEGSQLELRAILERRGAQGLQDYMDGMTRLGQQWGWPDGMGHNEEEGT